ncbi:MAG: helix-turn-helix transcriptional regulator [Candidatus Freyarchaeota archaeon]|nr:hypothetical protein [Candidatus Freyrarchaeum guaymaensis]
MEEKAYEIIREAGEKGLLQSDLWRKLGVNSREGSRVAMRLEKKGLIRRLRELYKGRWTYRIFANEKENVEVKWNTLGGCPCFTCKQISRCGIGQPISPIRCWKLTEWINMEASKI